MSVLISNQVLQAYSGHYNRCKKQHNESWNQQVKGSYDPYWAGVVDGLSLLYEIIGKNEQIHFSMVHPGEILTQMPSAEGWDENNRCLTKYVTTVEWWAGNFVGDKVEVTLSRPLEGISNKWRVSVCGNDDTQMGIQGISTEEEAMSIFDMIEDGVDFEYLRELGLEFGV